MSTLFSTKYKNPSRTISGSAVLFKDDVVLLCDTSSGAVNLTLLDIPADYWYTTWKLYVVDKSNNAATHNITINAPSGFKINSQSSLVINTNGGTAEISINSNSDYLGVLSSFTSNGTPLAIYNEGTLLTPTATSIDFVGNLINATVIGNSVTVNVANPFISVTNAQLLTLIGANQIIPNQNYLVTNAIFCNTTNETVNVAVQGITNNTVSINGNGVFLNADYQNVGNYSGVSGYAGNIGVWTSSASVTVNKVAIWNNLHYKNTTGTNTSSNPAVDTTNWTLLAKTVTNGYILEVDIVQYYSDTNQIFQRIDKRGNQIENNLNYYASSVESFYCFQWGNNSVGENSVNQESYLSCLNNLTTGNVVYSNPGIYRNVVSGQSFVNFESGNIGVFFLNEVLGGSGINISKNKGLFYTNKITLANTLSFSLETDSSIIGNEIGESAITFVLDTNSVVWYNKLFFIESGNITTQNSISYNYISYGIFQITNTISGNFAKNNFANTDVTITSNSGAITENVSLGESTILVTDNYSDGIIKGNNILSSSVNFGINKGNINYNIVENSTVTIGLNEVVLSVTPNINYNTISQGSTLTITQNTDQITYNEVSFDSTLSLTNNYSKVGKYVKGSGNIITKGSTLTIGTNNDVVAANSIMNTSTVTITTNNNEFLSNILDYSTEIQITTNNVQIVENNCNNANLVLTTNNYTFTAGTAINGLGTIAVQLDMNDTSIFNSGTGTLTIPTTLGTFCGFFILLNSNGKTVNKIIGLSSVWNYTFFNNVGTTVFNSVAVTPYNVNQIVSPLGANAYSVVHRTGPNISDSLVLQSNGFVHAVVQANIYL